MPTLPKDISYQKLYEPDQNIWFLNWILKQRGCDTYLNQIILSMPFTVERSYYGYGRLRNLIIFKNDIIHGLFRQWYNNCQLWCDEHWQNSKQHGLSRRWYDDGKLWMKNNWKNGKKYGLEQIWHDNGQLLLEKHWQNGQRHGLEQVWYPDGQLHIKCNWKNDKLHDLYQEWYPNGQIIVESLWLNGERGVSSPHDHIT